MHRALDAVLDAAEFKESEHPRRDDGKFGTGAVSATRGHATKLAARPLSFQKKASFVESELGVDSETAARYVRSASFYSGPGYTAVRSGKAPKSAAALEAYVQAAPKWDGNGAVYRGVSLKESELNALEPGAIVDMKGLSSWSSDRDVAATYAQRSSDSARVMSRVYGSKESVHRVMFKMDKADTGTSIAHFSKYPTEDEVLLSGKTGFKVMRIEEKRVKDQNKKMRTVRVVHVEEVLSE